MVLVFFILDKVAACRLKKVASSAKQKMRFMFAVHVWMMPLAGLLVTLVDDLRAKFHEAGQFLLLLAALTSPLKLPVNGNCDQKGFMIRRPL